MNQHQDIPTDFCIIGFPKCGTSALCRMMEKSAVINLAKKNGELESPYFVKGGTVPPEDYLEGKINGHKFSAYVYSYGTLEYAFSLNPNTVFILCVRNPKKSLFSWWKMHKSIAKKGIPKKHFVNQSNESQNFYLNCGINEYYDEYAGNRLDYAGHIERILNSKLKDNILILSQEKLAIAPGVVLARIHECLGIEADANYLASLKAGHQSKTDSMVNEIVISERILEELQRYESRLTEILRQLPPEKCLV